MTISTACPSPRDLRRTLERFILDIYEADGSTLKSELHWPGVYTLPNGSRTPAVYVIGSSTVPSSWNITGIECTIEEVPEVRSPGSMSGVLSFETWDVRFTNYGKKEGTQMPLSMRDIVRRLVRTFPRASIVPLRRTEATFEAVTARITEPSIHPPIP
jgi:hypothetical protein